MNYKQMIIFPLILLAVSLIYQILTGLKIEFDIWMLSLTLLSAFLLMSITTFIIFRKLSASLSIFLCEFANLIEIFAVSNLMGMNISLLSITSLFLILLYSISNNVFLIFNVLKEIEKTVENRKNEAMKTILLINGTIVFGLLVLFLISFPIVTLIAPILIIGLIVDSINTLLLTGELIGE